MITLALAEDQGLLRNALASLLAMEGDIELTGQAADGFHLLRLAQLLLKGSALGDVFGKKFEDDSLFAAIGHRAA